jgi:ankyrin repeat protein
MQQASLLLASFLVSKGADPQALDQRGRGLCHRAATAGNEKLLDWALDTLVQQPDLRDNNSRTPLLLAVEGGSVGIVRRLLQRIVLSNESDSHAWPERVVDAMEYANMRSSPLLRAMVHRAERKIAVVTALVEADEKAFAKLSHGRQKNLLNLRTAFYIESLCWAIDCDFPAGFMFLLPKILKSAISSTMNLDGDNVFHSAAAANGNEYLKTLLQTLTTDSDRALVLRTTNAQGKTPLDLVIKGSSWEKAVILLRSGAKVTPPQLQILKEKGSKEVQEVLLQYNLISKVEDQRESEDMYSGGGEVRVN